jgi:hypothetical protein
VTAQVGTLPRTLGRDPASCAASSRWQRIPRPPRRSRRQVSFLVGPKRRADRRRPHGDGAPCCRCATTARYLRPWFKSVVMAARVAVDQPSPDGIPGARSTAVGVVWVAEGAVAYGLDHPVDHPDDPTGPVWIHLDRPGIQPDQPDPDWSRPGRRRAPGYGSGGWGFESLKAHLWASVGRPPHAPEA